MGDRQAALILCPECPYPAAGGGALRTASLVEYLAERYALDAVVFRPPGGEDPRDTLLGLRARRILVLDLPYHRRHRAARAWRNLRRLWRGVPPLVERFAGFEDRVRAFGAGRGYRLALVEHFWCAPYAAALRPASELLALDLHNVESALHAGCGDAETWPLSTVHRRFARLCRRLERRWLPEYDLVLTASEADARRTEELSPDARVAVYPNTIPWVPLPERAAEGPPVVVFSGNLEYHPNAAAVRWFRREIWPRLRERHPELIWRLIGKNPEAVRRYVNGDARIELVGPVEDAVAAIARATVAVAPLLAGSGTRVKILEAWAAGVPVVSTPIGAEGLGATPGRELALAETAAEFAAAVDDLLRDAEKRRKLARAGRTLFESRYTWKSGRQVLERLGI